MAAKNWWQSYASRERRLESAARTYSGSTKRSGQKRQAGFLRLEKRRAETFRLSLSHPELRSLRIGNKHFAGLSDHCRKAIPRSAASSISPGTILSATTRGFGLSYRNRVFNNVPI